ncbi:MAG: hypothetical protein D6812_01570 [Deltaproteobacteria bacterium]|nr:MAG: hypothetical protein D6812_01570 [Deltaproteobacteria bacterium]
MRDQRVKGMARGVGFLSLLALGFLLWVSQPALAGEGEKVPPPPAQTEAVGIVGNVAGEGTIQRATEKLTAEPGAPLYEGDLLLTGGEGKLELILRDDTLLTLAENTQILLSRLPDPASKQHAVVELVFGKLRLAVGPILGARQGLELRSPTMLATVTGTEFFVIYDPVLKVTQLFTLSGRVKVKKLTEEESEEVPVSARMGVAVPEVGAPTNVEPVPTETLTNLVKDTRIPRTIEAKHRLGASVADVTALTGKPRPRPRRPGEFSGNRLPSVDAGSRFAHPPVTQDPSDLPVLLESRETVVIRGRP